MEKVELKDLLKMLEEKEGQTEQILVSLLDIEQMSEFNPRDGLDPETLKALEQVEDVPSIKLAYHIDFEKLVIIDGNHRFTSRLNRGEEEINAIVTHYSSKDEMFIDATKANLFHGLTLSKKDRVESLSKIVEKEHARTKGVIKFKELAERLGSIPPRELQKINAWNLVREKLNDERREKLGLNIAKADRFYSLIIKMDPWCEESFLTLFDNLIDLSFNNIFEQIREFLATGAINSKEEINKENIEKETQEVLNIIEAEDFGLDLDDEDFYEGELEEIADSIVIDDLVFEVLNDLKFKSSYLESEREIVVMDKAKIEKDIIEIRQLLVTLENELKG